MTNEKLTVYEKAVTTDRPAEMLANKHGFESVAQLAESLPQNARVLDVGAGASPFGKEIALLRPDVNWTNLDYSYQDPAILREVSQGTPANIQHVFGDATKLDSIFEPETFDAVFSYWLLPHLSLDDTEPARDTMNAIFAVTKQGGLVSVGPRISQKRRPSLKSGNAIQVIKDDKIDVDGMAEQIVTKTKLTKSGQAIQKLANEVATPFFGTSRYTKGGGRVPHVYDPDNGNYINPFSRRGVQLAGRLTVAAARYAYQSRQRDV